MKALSEYLATIGARGGSATSAAKTRAARANASLPPKPGSKPRGWPKGKPRKKKAS